MGIYISNPLYCYYLLIRCYWHACSFCYPNDCMVVFDGKTAGYIRAKNKEREDFLKDENDLEIYWECQVRCLIDDKKL